MTATPSRKNSKLLLQNAIIIKVMHRKQRIEVAYRLTFDITLSGFKVAADCVFASLRVIEQKLKKEQE
ncbi:MAG: hypothetical protein ACK5O1_04670 [Holosporales bacterium]